MKPNHLSKLARASHSILIAALALFGAGALKAANFFDDSITSPTATPGVNATIDLGNASGGTSNTVSSHNNWAIFALSGGVTITDSTYTGPNAGINYNSGSYDVWGNVGMAGGTLTMTNSWINGSAYTPAGGGVPITGNPNITKTGPTLYANYLNDAATSATSSSNAAASMVNTSGLSFTGLGGGTPGTIALSGPAEIKATTAGTYVLNLTDLILSGASAMLTLNGPSNANFVINVARYMSLSSQAQITLTGGIGPNNVLYNLTSATTNDVTLSGASIVNGIILAPNRDIKLSGGSVVTGETIGKGVSLSGRSKVISPFVSP